MNQKAVKSLLLRIFAAGSLYGLYVMLSALSLFAMRTSWLIRYVSDFWTTPLFCTISFIYSFIILFSLFSIFTLYDPTYKTSFFDKRRPDMNFFRKCRFVITSKIFLLQMGVILGLIVIFPTRPAFSSLITGFFHANGFVPDPLVEKLLVTAIAIVLFFVIGFAAHLSTVNWWMRQKSNNDTRFHPLKAALQLLSSTVLYLITASVITLVYPAVFVTLYNIVRTFLWGVIVLIVVLFVGFWGIVIGRILYKRYRMVKRLKSICREHGFRIVEHHSLFAAILSAKDGCDFTIVASEERFACKLIPSLSRRNNLFFYDGGTVSYTSSLMDVLFHTVIQRYFFEAEGKKIIIVNPVSHRLYAHNDREKRLLEVGDCVMDYSIHTASSFLSALDRGCL